MLRIGILISLLLFPGSRELGASDQRPLVFEREKIDISIGVKRIQVTGTYQFRNNTTSPRTQGVYYPLPVDSTHLYPDRIIVTLGPDTLAFEISPSAVRFKLILPPDSTAVFTVFYDQPCLVNDACYILTTTAAWERPLDRADFIVRVPDGLRLEWVSYEFDEVTAGEGMTIHRFSRQDFMPDKDLCLKWLLEPAPVK